VIEDILGSAANAFTLKDDIEVKFLCRIDFYPPHGAMRLIVESIDPVYTLGKIAQEKQRLIAKLRSGGILEKNKILTLSEVPLRIGLITADDSAAYNDFIHELESSGFAFQVYLRPALMQGRGAESDICRAVDELEGKSDLDGIVITRGGGSLADLSCFDSERIARRIAACRYPVLSGIGHEINITITDLAAHTYQKTPTAIARFLVETVETFLTLLDQKLDFITSSAQNIVGRNRNRLIDHAGILLAATQDYLRSHQNDMVRRETVIMMRPEMLFKKAGEGLSNREQDIRQTLNKRLKFEQERVAQYQRLVELASPAHTLRRGFSLTRRADGKIVRAASQVRPGDPITTQLAEGALTSRVEPAAKMKGDSHGADQIR
jgi:exodeoxyribonuclease VII large subunit